MATPTATTTPGSGFSTDGALKICLRDREGKVRAVALVSPDDAKQTQHRWALHSTGRAVRWKDGKMVYLHREVMGMGPEDKRWVSQRNGNGLDCRRENLVVRDRGKKPWRHYHLMRKYGIGADEWDALLAAQGGCCAICRDEACVGQAQHSGSGTGRVPVARRSICVDHDHDTGTIRGLLCWHCNVGIARFRDDPGLLKAAANYLEERA